MKVEQSCALDPRGPDRDAPRQFSVRELLTVVSIVALLAIVLLPTVVHAREGVAGNSRLDGLQSLTRALALYSQDYDGAVPRDLQTVAAAEGTAGSKELSRSARTMATTALGACASTAPTSFVSAAGGCRDTGTGLTWSATGHEVLNAAFTYSGAAYFCQNLNEQGVTGWRLPTESELVKFSSDGAYTAILDNYSYVQKWSSTSVPGQRGYGYAVILKSGAVVVDDKRYDARDIICVK